ncbi:MAG TPA: hypothetical protein VK922_01215, partial [Gemmatimonadaceae bacterium]|nr:hypothetical protein [Gemmatimonadaceae bacterium]
TNTAIAKIKLGDVLVRRGRLNDAKEHLRAGYEVLAAQATPGSRWLRTARERLAEIYAEEGDAARASRFRTELAAESPSGD